MCKTLNYLMTCYNFVTYPQIQYTYQHPMLNPLFDLKWWSSPYLSCTPNMYHLEGNYTEKPAEWVCANDVKTFLRQITFRRFVFLKVLHRQGELSINILPQPLKCNHKNVRDDVKGLEETGLIERQENGLNSVLGVNPTFVSPGIKYHLRLHLIWVNSPLSNIPCADYRTWYNSTEAVW